jgi:hypothetical protein
VWRGWLIVVSDDGLRFKAKLDKDMRRELKQLTKYSTAEGSQLTPQAAQNFNSPENGLSDS